MYALSLLPDRLHENENHVVSILKKIDARSYDDAIKEAEALVVFRILCHFVKLSKKEMTYDPKKLRHGCRLKAVA